MDSPLNLLAIKLLVANLGAPSNRYTYNDDENRYYTEVISYSGFATISLAIVKKVAGRFPHFKLPNEVNVVNATFLNGMYYSSVNSRYVVNHFYAKGNEIISSQTADIDYGFFYGIIKL